MADNLADTGVRMTEHGRSMAEDGKSAMSDVKTRFKNMASKCSNQAKQYVHYAADQSKHAKESTESFVRENPWYALGIAVGVGVLCGLALRSCSHGRSD